MNGSWRDADESALEWIREASPTSNVSGFAVQGLPDTITVLHEMYERIDGQAIPDESDPLDGDADSTWFDPLPVDYRLLTWREYARRRGVELTHVRQWPFTDGVTGGSALYGPEEGSIVNVGTWKALTRILTAHSSDGPDTWCTAYYYETLAFVPPSSQGPHIFRGRVGDSDELVAPPHVSYSSPQKSLARRQRLGASHQLGRLVHDDQRYQRSHPSCRCKPRTRNASHRSVQQLLTSDAKVGLDELGRNESARMAALMPR